MQLNKEEKQWFRENLLIDINHGSDIKFYCRECGLLIANGYNRVVIGDRGPYIEFLSDQMELNNLIQPPQFHIYFLELNSICKHKVFVYFQEEIVKYANYKKGRYYIDPLLVKTDSCNCLINGF